MNDIVTRLRDWRNVHLARLHLLMDEAADEMARLRSDNSRRANLEKGLRDGIERLSANGDCPGRDNAAKRDNTPATHGTPSERSEQSGCTLTDVERAAIESAIWDYQQNDDDEDCARMVATLERLLERMA